MIDKLKPFLKDGIDTNELTAVMNSLLTLDPEKLETAYLNNDPAVRSWADRKIGKSLETFKTQTMSSLIEQQVQDRISKHKNETAAETQLRLINERLDKAEKDRLREKHINDALKYAGEKGIPTKYVDKFLGEDFDTTKRYLDDFATDFNIQVDEEVDERFKESGRKINFKTKKDNDKTTFTDEEIAKMSPEDFKANFSKIMKTN